MVRENPYQSPAAPDADDIVDRAARASMAETIRRFLDDRTSAFEFDEALDEFRRSSDPTVRFVSQTVWYHYDDCTDHMVTLSKPEWDYFQRLLLLLESDGQIAVTSVRRWHWTQPAALGCLFAWGWCIGHFGWGLHLLVLPIPFGLVSMGITFLRYRNRPRGAYDPILTPFSTFAEMSAAYRATAGFSKRRYPRAITRRRIRSRVAQFGLHLHLCATWLLLSPIPLFVQTFPLKESRTQVRAA